jgi:hypothetical protein
VIRVNEMRSLMRTGRRPTCSRATASPRASKTPGGLRS